MRKLILAVFVVGAFCALGGGVAAPASADICAISLNTVGNYAARSPDTAAGSCNTPGTVGTKKYIIVLSRGRYLAVGEACAEVTETHKGNYANSFCTTGVAPGAGAFVKIKIKAGWFGAWSVEGKDAKELSAGAQITKLTTAKATLKTKIAGVEVKLNTSTAPEFVGIKLSGEGKLAAGGTVKFTGITTELNGKASAACTPLGTAGNDSTLGTITSSKGSGGIVFHEGAGVTQFLPETGTTLATLFFGEECSLPEKVALITKSETGKGLALTDPLGLGKELVEHEIAELSALTELWVISETAEHKVTLEGKAAVGLTSPHNGLKWKGTPDEVEVE